MAFVPGDLSGIYKDIYGTKITETLSGKNFLLTNLIKMTTTDNILRSAINLEPSSNIADFDHVDVNQDLPDFRSETIQQAEFKLKSKIFEINLPKYYIDDLKEGSKSYVSAKKFIEHNTALNMKLVELSLLYGDNSYGIVTEGGDTFTLVPSQTILANQAVLNVDYKSTSYQALKISQNSEVSFEVAPDTFVTAVVKTWEIGQIAGNSAFQVVVESDTTSTITTLRGLTGVTVPMRRVNHKGQDVTSINDICINGNGNLYGIDTNRFKAFAPTPVYDVNNGAFDEALLTRVVSQVVDRGSFGMEQLTVLLPVNGYRDISDSISVNRRFDTSYTNKDQQLGQRGFSFQFINADVSFVYHPLVKTGDAFIIPDMKNQDNISMLTKEPFFKIDEDFTSSPGRTTGYAQGRVVLELCTKMPQGFVKLTNLRV